MVNVKYERAYSEVLEILKYIPIEDYNKIPKERIKVFEKYAATDSEFVYNPSKTLDENKVSKITKGIIAILYKNYWATDAQREKIITWQKYERKRIENEKRERYNPDNIFKNKENININQGFHEESYLNNLPIEVKENNLFRKVIEYFKKIFHIYD